MQQDPAATGQSSYDHTGSGSNNNKSNGGLATRTEIGIATGIPCALMSFLSLGGLGLFHLRRQKKNKAKGQAKPEMVQALPPTTTTQQPDMNQQGGMMNGGAGKGFQGQGQQQGQWTEHKKPAAEIYGQQKYGFEMETATNRAQSPGGQHYFYVVM